MARDRLPPETFDLPVEKIRAGYYSDAYYNFARDSLLADGRHPHVLMQVFQKNAAILGGMDEAIAVLKLCSHDWDRVELQAPRSVAFLHRVHSVLPGRRLDDPRSRV